MKVTILSPDLSGNCLGRALVLADILALDHEVEVVGPSLGEGLWPPAREHPTPLTEVPGGRWPSFAGSLRELVRSVSGEVAVAVKPRLPSLGAALLARRIKGTPVVLDLDDDETALKPVPLRPVQLAGDLLAADGGASRLAMRRAIPHADAFTVASRWLQSRFGGELVLHAKDTDVLRPVAGRREEWRRRLQLGTEAVVLFLGTPRPWKGVEDAARAVQSLPFPTLLLVVGADDSDYARGLASLPRVRTHSMVPLSALPGFLEAADLVVIPQRRNEVTRAQMPSKLFDAMALARPILATNVSDMDRVLAGGRGIVVRPGSISGLAAGMARILQAPEAGREMGDRARAWCVEHASRSAAREPMNRALTRAMERRGG